MVSDARADPASESRCPARRLPAGAAGRRTSGSGSIWGGIDSRFHRHENGKDLSELPLKSVADLDCVVGRVDSAAGSAIGDVGLSRQAVRGRAVLFHTGWDRKWRTEAYLDGHPYLTERAADWLAKSGAALVGIDSMNIDSVATGDRPVHSVLLGREIQTVEHMRGLEAVPERGGRFSAVPVKVKGFGTFPVRAFVGVGG